MQARRELCLNTPPSAAFRAPAISLLAAALLIACGGGDADGPGQDLRFKARAQARESSSTPGTSAAELSNAERAEVQRRSREWASLSLLGTAASSNGLTVPPLYFGLAFTLEAAAQGDTLLSLRSALPATSSPAVSAALQQGLQRTLRAGETTILATSFFDSVTALARPGTFTPLTLLPLTAAQLQQEPKLRAAVSDQVSGSFPWPQVAAYRATWAPPAGGLLDVAMLRIQGPTRGLSGGGWNGTAMALSAGHWLIKIEPTAALANWSGAELNASLVSAAEALNQPGVVAEATWELPEMGFSSTTELNDRRGMVLAQDEVNANLRGLDGGGSYAVPSSGSASMGLWPAGFRYGGSQSVEFIFSPLNIYGPGYTSSGSVFTSVGFGLPLCPAATINLRPFFLALLQPSGNIALLARLSSFSGTYCTNTPYTPRFVFIPPG